MFDHAHVTYRTIENRVINNLIENIQLLADNPWDFTLPADIDVDEITLWCLIHPNYYYDGVFFIDTLVGWRLFKVNG